MRFSIEFVISAAHRSQFPKDQLSQIAFCGRSNVGKSSLINTLLNRKNIARISGTPGKTRQLNFYRITQSEKKHPPFYFVDLPGYGYAKVSKTEREQWGRLIEDFFQRSANLRAAISIIDSRIGATDKDFELLTWLVSLQVPIILIATKADKLSNKRRTEMLRKITSSVSHLPIDHLLMFSSQTKLGRLEAWKIINEFLK